ncbi:TPA: hypothetical protein ACK3JH_000129 [Mannheimia haemolytica]
MQDKDFIKLIFLDAIHEANIVESEKQIWKKTIEIASCDELRNILINSLKVDIEQADKLSEKLKQIVSRFVSKTNCK